MTGADTDPFGAMMKLHRSDPLTSRAEAAGIGLSSFRGCSWRTMDFEIPDYVLRRNVDQLRAVAEWQKWVNRVV